MHALDDHIIREYSGQSGHGSLPFFVGKQYGTGWLRNIARFAFPFVKRALGVVGNIASNTAEDMIHNENKSVGESLKENAVKEAKRVLKRKNPANTTINRGRKKQKLIV